MILTFAATALCSSAWAQGPGPEAQDRPGQGDQQEQAEQQTDAERRAGQRAWLARRLDELRRQEARIVEMIEKLDAGEPLPDVSRSSRQGRFEAGDRRPERGPPPPDPAPEERLRLVMQFAQKHFPEFASRLESEDERNPEGAGRIAARFWPRVAELMELEQTDSELFTIELDRLRNGEEIMSTVWRARREPPADETAREQLAATLRELVTRQFELRLAATTRRLESLRESVRQTEQELQEHESASDEAIDEQVERLLRMIERPDRRRGDREGRGRGSDSRNK